MQVRVKIRLMMVEKRRREDENGVTLPVRMKMKIIKVVIGRRVMNINRSRRIMIVVREENVLEVRKEVTNGLTVIKGVDHNFILNYLNITWYNMIYMYVGIKVTCNLMQIYLFHNFLCLKYLYMNYRIKK